MTEPLARTTPLSRRALLAGGGAAALGAASLLPRRARAQGKPGGVLTVASSALPPNIEPHMQGLDIFQRRKPLVYENLVWIDHGLEAKPELAERWEQRSPTEYVFHLRRGVRFHDGTEMGAEDVKYTYDRVRDPKVSPGANDLTFVKQIDVVDRATVRFVLSAPAATFLVNLGGKYNGVIPKDSAGDGKALLTKAAGTGPFIVEEFDPSRRWALKRNPAYWGAQKPLLDGIVYQAIPDESSIVAGLRTGQVHLAEFASALSFQVAQASRRSTRSRRPPRGGSSSTSPATRSRRRSRRCARPSRWRSTARPSSRSPARGSASGSASCRPVSPTGPCRGRSCRTSSATWPGPGRSSSGPATPAAWR